MEKRGKKEIDEVDRRLGRREDRIQQGKEKRIINGEERRLGERKDRV